MFWRFGGYANISTLDSILDKPDVTVEELLDESDLIQELKQQSSKLVEFLRDDAVLQKLLNYVVADKPPEDADEKVKENDTKKDEDRPAALSFFGKGKSRSRSSAGKKDGDGETEEERKEALRKKYAYVACEVLSSEVWSITEALVANQADLKEFWQYLQRPAPLDPLQAGYFTKVNETLLDRKTEEMLLFFKSLDGIVPSMLQHVDCPMVMDLLLKIISLEKHEGGVGIVDWLQQQDLIPLLLEFLSPDHTSSTQTSAGDFLKAIITISANATTQDQTVIGPNELTRQLVSDQCISKLISEMLRGGNALTVGVGIIIEVIRKNNSDYDLDNQVGPEPKTSDPIYLGTLLRQFANHVPDFMNLVRSKSAKKPGLKVAYGGSIEPLGFDRFKTCELMAELLHCSNMGLLNERGTEDAVRKRDAERAQLKAEGKLATPKAPSNPSHENSHEEFGSSVDSHGFHHARRPSDDDMGEKGTRRLEVQNADEDGFEQVDAHDDLPDEVTFDDLHEKVEQAGLPALEKVDKRDPLSSSDIPKPLSPTKKSNATFHFDPPPTQAADSPTSAGVTESIGKLGVDNDTVMSEGDSKDSLSDRPEAPAPLFSKKPPAAVEDNDDLHEASQSVATIQGDDSRQTNSNSAYETDDDGRPVVGDLLKMQFVEHHVVPTILDFFFRFPWNNFLHNVVYDVVQQVFNGTLDRGYNRTLAINLFTPLASDSDEMGLISGHEITDRILSGQQASDQSQTNKGMRLGYMGHLTLIAEEVCKFGNRQPPELLDEAVAERVNREEWVQYVEGILTETRERDNAVLGGVRPETAINRPMSIGMSSGLGGFSANAANALANAGISPQDSLAMSEGTVGQSFEINSGSMLGGFGDGEEDDEMEYERDMEKRGGRPTASEAFTEDEQLLSATSAAPSASDTPSTAATSIPPPPLNVPVSRARRQLAARLAQKAKDSQSSSSSSAPDDPDVADAAAVAAASLSSNDAAEVGPGSPELRFGTGYEREVFGGMGSLKKGSASRFEGLLVGEEGRSSDDEEEEEDDEVDGEMWKRRRRREEEEGEEDESSSLESDDDDDDDEEGRDVGWREGGDDDIEGDAGRDLTIGREGGEFERASSHEILLAKRRAEMKTGSSAAATSRTLASSSSSSSSSSAQSKPPSLGRKPAKRRPSSTTQAKERQPIMSDDEEDEEENARLNDLLDRKLRLGPSGGNSSEEFEFDEEEEEGMTTRAEDIMTGAKARGFRDDAEEDAQTSESSDDELVEIKPRRVSAGGGGGGGGGSGGSGVREESRKEVGRM